MTCAPPGTPVNPPVLQSNAAGPISAAPQQLRQQHQPPQHQQRVTDEDFLRLGPVEMLKFVRKTESDMARLAAEQHRQIQALVS